MDNGQDTQQGVNTGVVESTCYVDVWLPDAKDYPGLSGASPKIQEALGLDPRHPHKPAVFSVDKINVKLEPRFYKRDKKNLDIDRGSVAAISFSEDFATKYQCHSDEEQREKNGNVAVLAMMGGVLPAGKNFFRMGFSVETIAGILGDHVIHDRQVSHVFLIRVDNKLGDRFEEEFSRKIESQNCSLDILRINADVKKATFGVLNENVMTNNNTLTTASVKFVEKKATDEKKSVERLISQWLSNRIKSRSDEGLKSVVIYGYWDGYWDFVREVLRCEDFRDDEDWLYVESNYPLLTPILRYNYSGIELTDIVEINVGEIKEFDELTVLDEKVDNEEIKSKINPSDVPVAVEGSVDDIQGTATKTDGSTNLKIVQMKSYKGTQKNKKKPTGDALGRVRCFTGKLVEKESSFITFAKETVRLLSAAIRYAYDKLGKEKTQDHTIPDIRKRICEFLRKSKFYASEHLGAFFFRRDGELFFPLYRYNGKLDRQGNVRESCCKDEEFTKEAIADQLLQLSNSLNKITRAEIPRNLEVGNSDGAKNVFEEFSKMIAEISGGIEIKFVSYYPNTESQFYTWTDTQEKNVYKTERFINVSIFDDVCRKIQGVIQINLKDFDLEDNDAYRVYLVYERAGNVFDALTLAEWWNRQDDALQSKVIDENEGLESDLLPVKAVVFAKSRIGKQDGQTGEGLSGDEYKNIIGKAKYVHYYRDDHESKFNFDEILRGLCQLLECRQNTRNSKVDSKSNASFLYYIPEYVPEDNNSEEENSSKTNDAGYGQGGIVMTTRYKLSLFDLQIIENMVSRIFSKLKTCLAEHDVLLSNIKSAIGSIMSRNGSHNIGSHVLAALSHNVGTMPDDRILYQYIQQRMDYIATATTDFPAWRQPTMLVSGMMRQFLIQRHLLDHIAGSEGLRAYQFQNRSLAPRQDRTIRIHIRRIKDDINNWVNEGFLDSSVLDDKEKTVSFIRYGGQDNSYSALKDNKDVAVAIPGGVVGQHAFYTIVENVIRNAAKHDWAKVVKKNNSSSENDSGNSNGETYNLELYIDFRDNPKDGVVEFRVWTCVTENCSKIVHAQHDSKDEKDVIAEITKKICQCFVDSEGGLRKENWGIAEMRISAGYLRNCDIADIGGLSNYNCIGADNETMKIIRPVGVSLPDGTSAIGYRFDLYKPRELLIVLPACCNPDDHILEQANKNINQYGVWIKREDEMTKESDLSFSYVLFDSFDINNEYRQSLPFRVIASRIVANSTKLEGDASGTKCRGGSLDSARRLIPETGSPLFRYFDDAGGSSDIQKLAGDANTAKQTCEDLLERVYGIWMAHITKKDQAYLAIDILGGGGEKKSLVTKIDLLRFVLENSFNAAAKSFLESGYGKYKSTRGAGPHSEGIFEKVLRDIVSMKPREVTIGKVDTDQTSTDGIAMMAVLRRQLKEWFGRLYGKTMLVKRRHDEFASSNGYNEFIRYVCGPILDQAEVFLAKYEEDYSTLPKDFKIKVGQTGGSWPVTIHCGMQDISVEFSSDDTRRKELYGKGHVCYFRHSPGAAGDIRNYLEPLSGSQSYLGAFVALRDSLVNHTVSVNDKRFVTSLVENATMRILIIDERVSDFMDDHEEVFNKLGGLGVSVKDDEDKDVINLFESINTHDEAKLDEVMESAINGVAMKDFEVLIIHQGIIDKLLNGHEDVDAVKEFLKALIKRMHYVVVTTGRGSPANIPDEARVLPYSVIKDTLLKCYPEKMILVGAVMNILPVRNQKATKNKKGT